MMDPQAFRESLEDPVLKEVLDSILRYQEPSTAKEVGQTIERVYQNMLAKELKKLEKDARDGLTIEMVQKKQQFKREEHKSLHLRKSDEEWEEELALDI